MNLTQVWTSCFVLCLFLLLSEVSTLLFNSEKAYKAGNALGVAATVLAFVTIGIAAVGLIIEAGANG